MVFSQTKTQSQSNYTSVEEQQEHLRGGKPNIDNLSQNRENLIQIQQNAFPSLQANDFLPSISRWTSLGGLFLAGAVGVMFTLASVIDYKVTVQTQAVIRPAGELRLVQSGMEGAIINISAQENQLVKKGDIMAIVDDSQLQTNKNQLESSIKQGKLQLSQINAQIRAIDSQIKAESDRTQRAIISAEAELSRTQREYHDRQIITTTEVQEAEANWRQSENELLKAQKELQLRSANLKSAQVTLDSVIAKWQRYQTVAQQGAIALNQLEEAKLAVEQQKQEVEVQKASLSAHQQLIEQQKQAVKSAKARWLRSKARLNPSSAEVEIAIERIAQEQSSGEATLAVLNKEKEALIQQQISLTQQLERDNQELKQLENDLNKTTITATADGIITNLKLRNSGQNVRLGEEIAQIVPTDVPLNIKAFVSPQNIGNIAQGQNVQMRVSACPYTDYGTLKGKVSQISEDTVKTQINGNYSNVSSANQKGVTSNAFYEVTINPENISLTSGNNRCEIQLGMEGRADIITKEETVLRFLLRKAKLFMDF
jgi:multidrug efflux pump subunit AcrA (membrane-fusion protein)